MPKVYITSTIPDLAAKILKKAGATVRVNENGKPISRDELKKVFAEYDAVLSSVVDKIDDDVLSCASPCLKIIANYAVGFDNIDVLAAKRRGIVVTNTPGVACEAVAEHAFALILACKKRLIVADKYVRTGKFKSFEAMLYVSPQLWGSTIGIVGLGRIGTYVGHMAYSGFKMNIIYHDITRSQDFEMLTEAKQMPLVDLLRRSDVVTLHVPLTPTSRHLIGRRELRMMKEDAIFINTSRGAVVDEEALTLALREKWIAGAGLDVYEHEPIVPHALTTLGNVILTPHIASATSECRDVMAKIAAQNIIDVFDGKTPFGLVRVDQ